MMKYRPLYTFFGRGRNKNIHAIRNIRPFCSFYGQQYPAILSGKFNYNEAFAAFTSATHQKKDTALIVDNFAKKLKEKQVMLSTQPIRVADIGCANSSTCLQYLENIHNPLGFDYFGIDINEKFIQEAKATLSKNPIINKYTLINADGLSGRLKQREEFSSVSFDFIFISHVAYYLKNELFARAFLEDIMKLLSKPCGIAIFFHEDSTYHFRSTYNRNQFNMLTTPELLQKSARGLPANFNQFKTITFISNLHFHYMDKDLWEAAKNPNLYKNFADEPHFVDTLEKLAFIVQQDLIELAKEGCLAEYVDEIRDAISANNNCLDLKTHMQTLVAPQCALRHKIARALTETEQEIPFFLESNMDERNTFEKDVGIPLFGLNNMAFPS